MREPNRQQQYTESETDNKTKPKKLYDFFLFNIILNNLSSFRGVGGLMPAVIPLDCPFTDPVPAPSST